MVLPALIFEGKTVKALDSLFVKWEGKIAKIKIGVATIFNEEDDFPFEADVEPK